ncbi:MAG: phosphotransferase [Bacteroidales bacterium]|nr:phosphotransferase [Bacteroidales bacterium]
MNENQIHERIHALFQKTYNAPIHSIQIITGAGSPRKYYRILSSLSYSVIACFGTNLEENKSFIYYNTFFLAAGLSVPKIYASEQEPWLYLLEDFGDIDVLTAKQNLSETETITLYKTIIRDLIQFQLQGAKCDFSHCFSRNAFDETAMKWDLYYFKYYYLKLSNLDFNEQKLEEDFDALIVFLKQADASYFMYRDFQARNILLKNNKLHYIDFQGGMRGPLQYDLASLLLQAKAQLSVATQKTLIDFYISEISKYITISKSQFKALYEGFAMIRIIQTLGAYGFRGIIEKKPHFISSIPHAVDNAVTQISNVSQHIHLPYLTHILHNLPKITETK